MTSAFPGALDSFSTKVDAVDYVLASHINSIQEGIVAAQTAIGPEGNTALCEARLTLTTAVPVTTADVSNVGTIYFTPFRGARLALHNGTGWLTHILTEISIAVPNTTATMYDMFCYSNAGTPTLEALAWTNDTTRATALTTLDGVLVKTGATTRRYLGSFRTDDNLSAKCTDTALRRYLWNYYNRAPKRLAVGNDTSHTYNSGTFRPFNNDAANSQVQLVVGVVEGWLNCLNLGNMSRALSTDGQPIMSIAINSTATPGGGRLQMSNFVGGVRVTLVDNMLPVAGYNYIVAMESCTPGTAGATFAGCQVQAILPC